MLRALLPLLLLGAHAPADAAPPLQLTLCPTGFCPRPTPSGLPSGVMFVAVGLVGVGCAGLWQRSERSKAPGRPTRSD